LQNLCAQVIIAAMKVKTLVGLLVVIGISVTVGILWGGSKLALL
jgi:hypothetical protein